MLFVIKGDVKSAAVSSGRAFTAAYSNSIYRRAYWLAHSSDNKTEVLNRINIDGTRIIRKAVYWISLCKGKHRYKAREYHSQQRFFTV